MTASVGRPSLAATRVGPSIWVRLVVIVVAAGIAVVLTDLVDPVRRFALPADPTFAFIATYAAFLVLFGTGYALIATGLDLMNAWERATPESERRRNGGDSGGPWSGDGDGCSGDGGCD